MFIHHLLVTFSLTKYSAIGGIRVSWPNRARGVSRGSSRARSTSRVSSRAASVMNVDEDEQQEGGMQDEDETIEREGLSDKIGGKSSKVCQVRARWPGTNVLSCR